ncbi:deubiquitinating protein VCPIP1-like [Asterias amurensis]|uniref:deubiquitinating protein VCPIP1-like n=1 Tax=Asterias amurensis TaxID=7602 RepID=UPI003AB540F5
MLSRSSSQVEERYRMLSGHCPDEKCQTKLYFPSYDSSIECTGCGQRHERASLSNVQEVTDPEVALHNMVRNLLVGNVVPKQTADSVKVLGLSNYHCKLLSPLLTFYGMNKQGKAQPLTSLNQGSDMFDCSILGSRSFLIQPEHIGIMGYGRDQTGSAKYLKDTLNFINQMNGTEEVLIPIHADGDGHCLVHGISRALVGRELFWHALRTSLKKHFLANITKYKNHFKDFLDSSEWTQIIAESDPDYLPSETEAFGLQNIHIFGLANVLQRPIILLDSLEGLQSSGDYSGVFLPAFVPRESCSGKDGVLNKPLCVAWSSSGRNHFIALVGVKGRPLPRLPRWMLTKAWGTPHELIDSYIQFDEDDMCTVGGSRSLPDKYVQRLAAAMEEVFVEKYHLHPAVVADVHHYIYKRTGVVGVHQNIIIENTRCAVENKQLFRCLLCSALSQIEKRNIPLEWLRQGGELYDLAKKLHGRLQEGKLYAFPLHELNCSYDATKDELVPDQSMMRPSQCAWCQGKQLRQIQSDGSIVYFNGDRTNTPAPKTKCNCGFKHYWDGQEYDNNPAVFPVSLKWKGQFFTEDVMWFQGETNTALNSNAYEIASALVQKHFPGEFGSEKLVQQVVETILQNTAAQEEEYQPISLKDMPSTSSVDQSASSSPSVGEHTPEHRVGKPEPGGRTPRPRSTDLDDLADRAGSPAGSGSSSPRTRYPRDKKGPVLDDMPSKIILTGLAAKTLHKEELDMSEAERNLRRRIEERAPSQQSKASSSSPSPSEETRKHKQSPGTKEGRKSEDSDNKMAPVAMDTVTSVTKDVPKTKRIRLTSSDGKQATLILEPSTTFSELQGKIEMELNVKADSQKIRYGFPPKELTAPIEGQESEPVPLQNGDRVTVEVVSSKVTGQPMDTGFSDRAQHSLSTIPGSSTFPEVGSNRFSNREEIMRGMESLQQETGDNLDLRLYSLNLMATLTNTDMWTYVQQHSALFERGGTFYAIVERDLGLTDGKHFVLPSIQNKKFTYNAMEDRIEICLEPIGHFPIRPGVDESDSPSTSRPSQHPVDLEEQRSEFITGVRSKLKAGSSGVVTSGGQQVGGYRAFSGHGQTLASGAGQRLSEAPAGSSMTEDAWESPRWAQYQREFNKLLEGRGMAPDMPVMQSQSVAVEMPEESPGMQVADRLDNNVQSESSAELQGTVSQSLENAASGDGLNKTATHEHSSTGFYSSTSLSVNMSPRDELNTEESIDVRGESDAMEVDKTKGNEQHALPSPLLPMEVDLTLTDNTQINSQPHTASVETTGVDTSPVSSQTPLGESDASQDSDSSRVYVSKRLGPGYMVLVEQPSAEPSDSDEGVTHSETT